MTRVQKQDLIWHFGDSFDDYQVTWKDSLGNPINLTGYTATLKIRDAENSTSTLRLTLDSSGNGLVITAASGLIDFSATPTKMTSGTLAAGTRYFYDLQVSSPAEIKTLIKGMFFADQEVTN